MARLHRKKQQSPVKQPITAEQREKMIAETAYFISEKRGFVGDHQMDDWLESEKVVDKITK